VIDKASRGRVDYAELIIGFGGDMSSILDDIALGTERVLSYQLWRDYLESLQATRGNSFLTAILQLMERRHKEALEQSSKRSSRSLARVRLTDFQKAKGTALFEACCPATSSISKTDFLVQHGGDVDQVMASLHTDPPGKVTLENWFDYLKGVKTRDGDAHLSFTLGYCERKLKEWEKAEGVPGGANARLSADEEAAVGEIFETVNGLSIGSGTEIDRGDLSEICNHSEMVPIPDGTSITLAELTRFFRGLKQSASNGLRYLHLLQLWLRQALNTKREQAEVRRLQNTKQAQGVELSPDQLEAAEALYNRVDQEYTGRVEAIDFVASPIFAGDAARYLALLPHSEQGVVLKEDFVGMVLEVKKGLTGDREARIDAVLSELEGNTKPAAAKVAAQAIVITSQQQQHAKVAKATQLSVANSSRLNRIFKAVDSDNDEMIFRKELIDKFGEDKVEIMALPGEPVPHNFTGTEFRKHFVTLVEDSGEEMVTHYLELLDEYLTRESHSAAGAPTIPSAVLEKKPKKKRPAKAGGLFCCTCATRDDDEYDDFSLSPGTPGTAANSV